MSKKLKCYERIRKIQEEAKELAQKIDRLPIL